MNPARWRHAAFLLLALAPAARGQDDPRPLLFVERTFARIAPRLALAGTPLLSPNGLVLAAAVGDGARWAVTVNGVRGRWFDGIGDMEFAPDGRTLYYVAREGTHEVLVRDHLVLDDPKAALGLDRIERFVVRPDSRGVAWVGLKGGRRWLVVDQKATDLGGGLKGFELWYDASRRPVCIGEDAKSLHVWIDGKEDTGLAALGEGFRISVHATKEGQAVYVGEGEPGRIVIRGKATDYDGLRAPRRDRNRVNFLARRGRQIQKVEIDLDTLESLESSVLELPEGASEWTVDPGGRHVALVAAADGKQRLRIDGPILKGSDPPCDLVQLDTLRVDAATKSWACVVTEGKGTFVDVRGRRHGPWENVSNLVLGDGGSAAWVAHAGEQVSVVHDGRSGPRFDRIQFLGLAPGGKTPHYVAERDGRSFTVIGTEATSRKGWDESRAPSWSRDGTRWAHRARSGDAWKVISGGGESTGFVDVGVPWVSDDGKVVAFVGRTLEGDRLVVNGKTRAAFDRIFAGPFPSPDGTLLAFVARRDDRLLWKVIDVDD